MNQYKDFAQIYDFLMDTNDYDHWVKNILKIYERYNYTPTKILELGCGTGNITNRLAEKNYVMIGTDISEEMLAVANEKAMDKNLRVKYLKQDMIDLDYNKKVDSIISICDGINYVLDDKDLEKVFNNVYEILVENGLFIFDISTKHKLKNIIGDNIYFENHDDFTYIWDNQYDNEKDILDFELTIFLKDNGLFERNIEYHKQKAHEVEKIRQLLDKKFEVLNILDSENLNDYSDESKRVYFIARKVD